MAAEAFAGTRRYDLACFLEKLPAPHMPRVDSCAFWAYLHYEGQPAPRTTATKKPLDIGGSRGEPFPPVVEYRGFAFQRSRR